MTSLIAYDNRALGSGAFTAGTGTWASSPSIDNLGKMQPQVYAEVTPSSGNIDFTFQAQDSAGSAESFTPDVFALLGHTLPDGADVEFFDGATSLGRVIVSNVDNRPQNAIVVTDSTASFNTLTVEVSSAGSDKVQIGCLWCSRSFRPTHGIALPYGITPDTLTPWTRVDTTLWPNPRGVVNRASFQMRMLSRSEAHGPDMPNWSGITSLVGRHSPLILIPDDSRLYESTYGLIETFQQIATEQVPKAASWQAGADLLEMR